MLLGIRRFIRSSPLLYLGCVLLRGRYNPDVIPSRNVDLFVTSFGRSGNTFCLHMVRECFPHLRLASHGHLVATLKLAVQRRIPALVTIRDPLEVCASSIVKFQVQPGRARQRWTRRTLTEWMDFYRYVREHPSQLEVLSFQQVTDDPAGLVQAVEKLGFSPAQGICPEEVYQRVEEKFHRSKLPPQQHCIPNPIKERRKQQVRGFLASHPLMQEARALHRKLLDDLESAQSQAA